MFECSPTEYVLQFVRADKLLRYLYTLRPLSDERRLSVLVRVIADCGPDSVAAEVIPILLGLVESNGLDAVIIEVSNWLTPDMVDEVPVDDPDPIAWARDGF